MSNRLLSLLTEIESALIANDPAPDGGRWDTSRLVNFKQGLARLTLAICSPTGMSVPRGSILLQCFALADSSLCMKSNLSWEGIANSTVYAIYSKPGINWHREAGQIAVKWLDGQFAMLESPAADQAVSGGAQWEKSA